MGKLVTYTCIEDSYDWGKKGMTNKIFFPQDYTEEFAKSYAPSNWIIQSVEDKETLDPIIKEEE